MSEKQAAPETDILFEVSWEVCNKVGGINTVLKSKAGVMQDRYKQYILIGPYFEKKAMLELERKEPPKAVAKALDSLKKNGIECHYGTWQVKGEPTVILIDFSRLTEKKDELKAQLWESYEIDSMGASWDFEEPVIFSAAVAQVLNALEKAMGKKKVVAHFHEWMTGAGILFLKRLKSPIRTVFTTHATMLGRAIAGGGENLYEMLENINPREAAYSHGVQAKHLTETACAHECNVFTTVSEITGMEAEKLLGRKPDVLVLNGLEVNRFPTFEETSIKHLTCRESLRSFLTYYFFPHYLFSLDHNLIFFITGRYEYKNKGIDLTIHALGRLNELLKQGKDKDRTVSVFFWIPMEHAGVKVELLENKNYYNHITSYIHYNADNILQKVLYDFLSQKDVKSETLFTKEFLKEMKKDLLQFKRQGNPPLCTNYLPNEDQNDIIKALIEAGLDNREDDRVKVIVQPVYLDGSDGLVNLPYYDAIAGTHLGLFPSYYEPWGYTPLETGAMGVSCVTTDLAGFGRFIEPHLEGKSSGIKVLHRLHKPYNEIVEDFAQKMYGYCNISHTERVQNKIQAKELSQLCDWGEFIRFYIKAHNMALK
ncbi:hypothetical protein GOV07_01670 [Candidatus Woesearchaeota archaeon]|nr:hypothetical protein [Candidatus Woesearchaeota archaeon]